MIALFNQVKFQTNDNDPWLFPVNSSGISLLASFLHHRLT